VRAFPLRARVAGSFTRYFLSLCSTVHLVLAASRAELIKLFVILSYHGRQRLGTVFSYQPHGSLKLPFVRSSN